MGSNVGALRRKWITGLLAHTPSATGNQAREVVLTNIEISRLAFSQSDYCLVVGARGPLLAGSLKSSPPESLARINSGSPRFSSASHSQRQEHVLPVSKPKAIAALLQGFRLLSSLEVLPCSINFLLQMSPAFPEHPCIIFSSLL